ncbi:MULTISPECIES: hypothetical protein [Streptococcus]|uniref:Phage protein n=1 Tax=Streptococcus varani TaxID=1608583 RepID=A0A0E3WEJ5_9STRE|nr:MULTISPECIES: hypothetical protein [Streptococcus]CRT89689.1 Uncharacterised protein [Streptococcus equi subsp. equi]MBS7948076.1 hypothetical protein [Streptococcus suis]MDG3099647.1 hypothetical protein [Streptococcus suis]CQR23789.1 hypothetical protein BN1356_00157 [Streptococcus varani]CYZ86531.1 Uncharacterised protein [Streptococcus suis]
MATNEIEISNEQALMGTQLQIGKQVMMALLELHSDSNKGGIILPIKLNDIDFNVTIERD